MPSNLAYMIEDDPQLSVLCFKAVKAGGYDEVERITDGNQAEEALRKRTAALAILDLNLPLAGGLEILSEIRAQARLRDTHVVLTSAGARKASKLSDLVEIVLTKPVPFFQLRDIAACLRPG